MCNVFGGVLFIALLLSLSTKSVTNAKGREPATKGVELGAELEREIAVLERTLAAEQEKLSRYAQNRKIQLFDDGREAFLFDPAKDDVDAILQRIGAERERARAEEARRNAAESDLQEALRKKAEAAQLEAEVARLDAELSKARGRRDHASEALKATKDQQSRIARTPLLRETTKAPFIVSLAGGKLVPVYRVDALGVVERNTATCDFKEEGDKTRVVCKVKGVAVGPKFTESTEFQAIFGRLSKSRYYVEIGTEPDSFKECAELLRELDGAGFEVNWAILDAGGPMYLVTVKSHEVQ